MEDKNKEISKFGYNLGRAFGVVIVGCLAALSISVTVRLIMWIL